MKNAGVSCSSKCPDSVHGSPLESREAADLEKKKKSLSQGIQRHYMVRLKQQGEGLRTLSDDSISARCDKREGRKCCTLRYTVALLLIKLA